MDQGILKNLGKCCDCGKLIEADDVGPVFYQKYDACNKYKSLRKPARWHQTCWNNWLKFKEESKKREAEKVKQILLRFGIKE